MAYEGPPIIFRIDKIANDGGCSVPGSLASLIDMAFFCHKSGFYMVQGGQTITPIGRGKIDRTFWAEFDETNHFRASSAIDPVRGLYVFAYPANGSGGTPTRLLIYTLPPAPWTRRLMPTGRSYGGRVPPRPTHGAPPSRAGPPGRGLGLVEHAGHRRSRCQIGGRPMSLPALHNAADTRSITERVNVLIRDYNTLLRVPAGCILPYAGTTAPDGFLLCAGQAVSRAAYADLFAA